MHYRMTAFRRFQRLVAVLFFGLTYLWGFSIARAEDTNDAALSDKANTSEWLAYGRTYSGQRFSPLTQVNTSNVKNLGVAFYVDLPKDTGLVSTPLVKDGVMYFRSSRDFVYAVSATTGKQLWTWNPHIGRLLTEPGRNPQLYGLWGGRGIALWGQDDLYTATVDGRLVCLDRRTGKVVWSVQTFDPKSAQYIVGAPTAFHGLVTVGIAGTEFGAVRGGVTRWNRGFFTAYDASTGKKVWRFYVVPGDPAKGYENKAMAFAAKTWSGQWWKFGGGGNAWGEGYIYDPELNTLYVGTGNGNPLPRYARGPGDNLFISSIVALNADTGKLRWYYQLNPGEQWGWDAITPMIMANLRIHGQVIPALMLAPKNGFFYVINRATGKLVSAEPYTFENWASKIDLATGRPVYYPSADYSKIGDAFVWPGGAGSVTWQAISYNPLTGLVYIPQRVFGTHYVRSGLQEVGGVRLFSYYEMLDTGLPISGSFEAWDPVHQRRVWQVPMPGGFSPGSVTTAGNLVFHGQYDGEFVAFNAANGKELWRRNLGLGITAPPITYEIGGTQYVAILVGFGSTDTEGSAIAKFGWTFGRQTRRLVVFSLSGKEKLPTEPPGKPSVPMNCPNFKVNPILADKGASLFVGCALCHSGYLAPDLMASPIPCYKDAFFATVRNGRPSLRMPPWRHISDEELSELENYIRQQANLELKEMKQKSN